MSAHSRITYPQKNFFNFSILTKLIYIPVNCNFYIAYRVNVEMRVSFSLPSLIKILLDYF